jgi:uncharacterized protein
VTSSAIWRRLDIPGHDAARVCQTPQGWHLEGHAVFKHAHGPARVSYRVDCAPDWITRRARVDGYVGDDRIKLNVERSTGGQWRLNDRVNDGLGDALDVDFGFTPATNFLQLRRCNLSVGQKVTFSVAWLDLTETSLIRLEQRYEKRSESTYWYESPQSAYKAMLEIADSGFVRSYPGLWILE